MKINKLLAAVVVAAFALPVMAQNAPAPAPAPAPAAPMAAPAPDAAAPAKPMHKKHHHKKSHAIKATPTNKGA
ncbi:hypothetical protein [Collimonas sp.]|jgi:hypothetical protein|uniref:hypothetical protein n=1 Tax=Collimonas sp. TaxID=1963772 RepID=UPI002C12EA40|nr:hypothetical protein [Collimonas sp.]HWW08008.1 hypothetical protein [Collimonas sp.]